MNARTLFVLATCASLGCTPLQKPPTREVIELRGTPYDRGFQHGTQLKSKIHSFYTTLLSNSLFPYFSREQPDIAGFLPEYSAEKYQNGQFAYQLMLESAKQIERSLGRDVRDELRGIAEGSGMTYDEILVLNTFFDTSLAVRGVALAIRLSRAPLIKSVEFVGAATDGADNDGDGMVDEAGEGTFDPYLPELFGLAVELNPNAGIRVVLTEVDGVNGDSVRLFVDNQLYTSSSPEVRITELSATDIEVIFTPSTPLPMASTTTFVISAGDKKILETPPPSRASFMRDEEIAFTTRGAGIAPRDVLRVKLTDGRTRPPPIAIGVRGSVTAGARALLAHHFSLLDANTAHKHTVVLRHIPETGPAFLTVGWAGVAFGLSGVSERGVGYACNPADTLDNSVVGSVLENALDLSKAKLVAKGVPIGFLGRRVLETATTAAEGRDIMINAEKVYGWTCVISDKNGGLEAVEMDSNIFNDTAPANGNFPFSSTELDSQGRRWAGLTDDEIVLGSNYVKNVPDITTLTVAGQRIIPQRQWSGFFYRSRRAADGVKARLAEARGTVDVPFLQQLIADPQFVDSSDSMNAVVIDLAEGSLTSAMGTVPATASAFETTLVRP